MTTGWITRQVTYTLVFVATVTLAGCVSTPGVTRSGDQKEFNAKSHNQVTTKPAENSPEKKKRRKMTPDERRAIVKFYKEQNSSLH